MNTFTMTKVGLMNHPTNLLKTKVHKITGKRRKKTFEVHKDNSEIKYRKDNLCTFQ